MHILDNRRRSLFTEAVNQNVVKIYTRGDVHGDYGKLLGLVSDDTLAGVPLAKPLALQTTSLDVVDRLTFAAIEQKFQLLPTIGAGSSGEALARFFKSRSRALRASTNLSDRNLGLRLERHVRDVEHHLRHLDHAGVRRATLVWLSASRRTPLAVSNPDFLLKPYKAMLSSLTSFDRRSELRREMLEVALLYQLNLALQFGATVYWPKVSRRMTRPDLLNNLHKRGHSIASWQHKAATITVKVPPISSLLRLGPDIIELRQLGSYYFEDIHQLEEGKLVPAEQLREDAETYARNIRRVVRSGTAQLLAIASTVSSTLGPTNPTAAMLVGGLTSISALFEGPGMRCDLTLYQMRPAVDNDTSR